MTVKLKESCGEMDVYVKDEGSGEFRAVKELPGRPLWWAKPIIFTWLGVLLLLLALAYFSEQGRQNERAGVAAWQSLAERSATAFIVVDSRLKVVSFSSGAEAMFGLKASEMLGGSVEPLIPPRMRAQHRDAITAAIERGRLSSDVLVVQCVAMHSDGHEFPAKIELRHVPGDDGRSKFIVMIDHAESVKKMEIANVR